MGKVTKARRKAQVAAAGAVAPGAVSSPPTLGQLLRAAAAGYAASVVGYLAFCEAYAKACDLYGRRAREAFADTWAFYTPSMWRRAAAIGHHELMPHFAAASDRMVRGLLRLGRSMASQRVLVGLVTDGGMLRLPNADGTETERPLDALTEAEERQVLTAMGSARTPEELRSALREARAEWALRRRDAGPAWEADGGTLRIRRAVPSLAEDEWRAMGEAMGWTAR